MNSRARWAHLKESIPSRLARCRPRGAARRLLAIRSVSVAGLVITAVVLAASSLRGSIADVGTLLERDQLSGAQSAPLDHAATLNLPSSDAGAARRVAPRTPVPAPAEVHGRTVRHEAAVHQVSPRDTPSGELVRTRGYHSTAPPGLQS